MVEFVMAHLMWLWLALFVVFLVIEACTMYFTTIWAAIASFVMIFLSLTHLAFKWQLLVFVLLTLLLAVITRPFVVKKLGVGKNRTNVNSMEGQEVILIKEIKEFEKGEAKAKNGVVWTASSFDGKPLPANTKCIITKVEGNTIEVKPVE